jgi:hypothetical protein
MKGALWLPDVVQNAIFHKEYEHWCLSAAHADRAHSPAECHDKENRCLDGTVWSGEQ